jgi:hypothetical protein
MIHLNENYQAGLLRLVAAREGSHRTGLRRPAAALDGHQTGPRRRIVFNESHQAGRKYKSKCKTKIAPARSMLTHHHLAIFYHRRSSRGGVRRRSSSSMADFHRSAPRRSSSSDTVQSMADYIDLLNKQQQVQAVCDMERLMLAARRSEC